MNENHLNFREIQDEHLDQIIRLAFKQEAALRTQELIIESEKPFTPEQQARAEQIHVRMLEQINQEERNKRSKERKERARRIIPRIIVAAACVVLVIGVAAPIAIANVEFIRSAVMKMLIRIDLEKGEVRMNFVEDDTASFDIPSDWPGEYFPSYMPEGFDVTWKSYVGENPCIEYTSQTGQQVISFDEMDSNTTAISGIEGGVISYVEINGYTAIVIETENPEDETNYHVDITWDNGEKWFGVGSRGIPREETLKIAQSVKKIIKK